MRATRRGWWRRNAVALGAMVLALVATVLVGIVLPVVRTGDGLAPVRRIAAGTTGRIGEASFELTKVGEFRNVHDSSIDVPRGSMVLAVLIRVRTPRTLAASCSVSLVRDGTDKISWDPLTSPSDYGYGLSTSTEHLCSLDEGTGSRLVEQTFLVPRAVYGHVTVHVDSSPTGHGAQPSGTLALELPATPYSNTAAG